MAPRKGLEKWCLAGLATATATLVPLFVTAGPGTTVVVVTTGHFVP